MKNFAVVFLAVISAALAVALAFSQMQLASVRDQNQKLTQWIETLTSSEAQPASLRDATAQTAAQPDSPAGQTAADSNSIETSKQISKRFTVEISPTAAPYAEQARRVVRGDRVRLGPQQFVPETSANVGVVPMAAEPKPSPEASAGETGAAALRTDDRKETAVSGSASLKDELKHTGNAIERSEAAEQPTFPRSTWSFSGFSSAESSFQSFLWAAIANDTSSLLRGIDPAEIARLKSDAEAPDSEALDRLTKFWSDVKSFHVLENNRLSENESVLTVDVGDGVGNSHRQFVAVRRDKFEWRFAGSYNP